MKKPSLKFTRKIVKTLAFPFKKLATDEALRKELLRAALKIGVAYAEAKISGRGDEFLFEFTKEF